MRSRHCWRPIASNWRSDPSSESGLPAVDGLIMNCAAPKSFCGRMLLVGVRQKLGRVGSKARHHRERRSHDQRSSGPPAKAAKTARGREEAMTLRPEAGRSPQPARYIPPEEIRRLRQPRMPSDDLAGGGMPRCPRLCGRSALTDQRVPHRHDTRPGLVQHARRPTFVEPRRRTRRRPASRDVRHGRAGTIPGCRRRAVKETTNIRVRVVIRVCFVQLLATTEIAFADAGERLVIRHDPGGSPDPYVGGTLLAIRRAPDVPRCAPRIGLPA